MGSLGSKPPVRVVLPDDEEGDDELLGPDFVDTEKQVGEDTLGVPGAEDGYPDPEPPAEDLSPRVAVEGSVSRHGVVPAGHRQSTPNVPEKGESKPRPVSNLPNGTTEPIAVWTTIPSKVTSRNNLDNVRRGTPSKISRRLLRHGYPLSALPKANKMYEGGLPMSSVIHTNMQRSRSLYSVDLNQTTPSLGSGRRIPKKRETLLFTREQYEIRAMMATRGEQHSVTGHMTSRSEVRPPEVTEDISPMMDFDHSAADRKAEECRDHRAETYSSLIKDLTSGLVDDSLKVWAILAWISKQKIGKFGFGAKPPKPDTPNGYMKLIQDGQGTYPAFFALLCRQAGIKCALIHGVSKSAKYEVGDSNVAGLRGAWNAVYVGGSWRLVHPLWVCRSLQGHQRGGWVTIEKAGEKMTRVQQASSGQEVASYDKYYIFTDPKEFVFRNLPDDERWQLLKEPWSMEKFVQMPYVRPEFFERGFKFLSDEKCVLESEDGGRLDIAIGFDPSISKDLVFSYELSLALNENGEGDNVIQRPNSAGRYVVILKTADRVTVEVRFPCKGSYRLRLFAGLFTDFGDDPPWISDVRIECRADPRESNPLPYSPGVVGWGPGPVAENLGLYVPSHDSGLIDLTEEEDTLIQFILVRKMKIKVALLSVRMNSEFLNRFVKHELVEVSESVELRVKVTCPQLEQPEELALRLDVWSKESRSMENACNYLLRTRKERPKEGFYVRKARRMLNEAVSSSDVTALEEAVEACEKQGLNDEDPDVHGGKNKLEFLQCRNALKDSLLVNRIEVSESALSRSRSARFHVLLTRDIRRAEAHLRHIRDLNSAGWCNRIPEIDRSTLMELSHMRQPRDEIKHLLIAMFLLLGVNEEELYSWGRIQLLLRSQENTLVEMARLERDLNVEGVEITSPGRDEVERVQGFLDTCSEEEIRRIDNTAAAFYQWVSTVTSMLRRRLQETSIKSEEPAVTKQTKLNHIEETSEYSKYSRTGQ